MQQRYHTPLLYPHTFPRDPNLDSTPTALPPYLAQDALDALDAPDHGRAVL